MIIQAIDYLISGRHIALAGYGREGKALLNWLMQHYPDQIFTVADKQELPDSSFPVGQKWIGGEDSMSKLSSFDLIIKTPGIPSAQLDYLPSERITSQTELFLSAYGPQTLGITGTKGKSTTTSLIYHILKTYTDKVVLTGNIGIPPFTVVDQLDPATAVVMELSAHQLELVKHCPHISVLLNLFEEHLDH
ncbi:MAG TPA: Mur ligase family protein, partial [Bacteroidales bacterium]|nr:Mur ligase family protein [Bacteroidales bacterium]